MREQTARALLVHNQTMGLAIENDEALAVRGDADSFTRLYRVHVRVVYRYLLARLGNGQDAEDVTAQVFERAWTSLSRYAPSGSFKSWLFTIAQRALIDHYRHHPPRALSVDSLVEVLLDPAAGPEDGALASEQVRQVFQIITSLNDEQQEVIRLRFLAELRYDEIAQLTGKRLSAVKMSAYRALEEIRKEMSR